MDIFAIDNFKALVAVTATIIGGIWAFYIFVAERNHYPKLEVSIVAECSRYDDNQNIIYAKVKLENTGKVVVRPEKGKMKLQQITPPFNGKSRDLNDYNYLSPKDKEVLWPMIGERDYTWEKGRLLLEPGEKEEIDVDFLVFNTLDTVRIHGYVNNPYTQDTGWGYNLTINLRDCNNLKMEKTSNKKSQSNT